jgi:hypothetical protein
MKKNTLLALSVILFVIILSSGLWFLGTRFNSPKENQEATPLTSEIILFYGTECPHCQELEAFLVENKVSEKVAYDSVEIWHNKKNQALMISKAVGCGLKEEELGVPMLYAEEKCLVGPSQIEDFFKTKAGI